MLVFLLITALTGTVTPPRAQTTGQPYAKIQNGVQLRLQDKGPGSLYLRLQFISPRILHVMVKPDTSFAQRPTEMILCQQLQEVPFQAQHLAQQQMLILTSGALKVHINLINGQISYRDTEGQTLLEAEPPLAANFKPVQIAVPGYYDITQQFINTGNTPLFGLGGNQLGFTDLRGKDLEMIQYNSNVFNPFLVSTGHFALFWNNSSITYYGHPELYQSLSSVQLFDQQGRPGALSATYITDSTKAGGIMTRREKTIGYQFAKDTAALPVGFTMTPRSIVRWEGRIATKEAAAFHDFILKFGGYIQVWLDGKLVTDMWRQAWNPAEASFGMQMEPGKKYPIKVVWRPDGAESFASLRTKAAVKDQQRIIRFHSEAGQQIDYYVLCGQNMDELVGGYRQLTGKAPILPKWAYGFWQSKEHYDSQQELLHTARTFRERQIPIDNIVQDWYYWKKDDWGSQRFDSSRYPNPAAMIDQLHDKYNLHFMISVWPKFYQGSKYFQQFWDQGWLYQQNVLEKRADWMGYVSTFYDAYNPKAGQAFWNIVKKNIFSKGVDAWWLDATEPDIVDNITNQRRMELMTPTYGKAPEIHFNAYALAQDKTFYEGLRQAAPDKRVFILTRSATGGAQRYSAATWSGDIGATWQEMHRQIATGINFSLSGIPFWSMDIGGFAVEGKYQRPTPALLEQWRELQTRWFQFGSFAPIFRSHGQAPAREMFNIAPQEHPAYQSMLYYDQLRYRLMPYTYGIAAETYFNDYTPMRALAMDFPEDVKACAADDAFLYGPSLLVAPVVKPGATSRSVYLPKATTGSGTWYCLYDGKAFAGGQTLQAAAPYERMPVFVPAGAIVPVGPVTQHTAPLADTLDLYVYDGKDGSFTLYQDQGDSYAYQQGVYQKIRMHYQNTSGTLSLEAASGSYQGPGVSAKTLRIFLVSPATATGIDSQATPTRTVRYTGQALKVPLK